MNIYFNSREQALIQRYGQWKGAQRVERSIQTPGMVSTHFLQTTAASAVSMIACELHDLAAATLHECRSNSKAYKLAAEIIREDPAGVGGRILEALATDPQ